MEEYKANKDYTKSKLGYEDNTAAPGKDGYNTTSKSEGANAHRKTKKPQDGMKPQSDSVNAFDVAGWDEKDSEGDN